MEIREAKLKKKYIATFRISMIFFLIGLLGVPVIIPLLLLMLQMGSTDPSAGAFGGTILYFFGHIIPRTFLCGSQESDNSMWNPGNYIPALKFIDLPMTVTCAFQSHSMNALMERLQAEGAVKKEKLGLSILPIRS